MSLNTFETALSKWIDLIEWLIIWIFDEVTGGSCRIGYHLSRCFAKELKEEFQCPQVIFIDKDLSKPNSAREIFKEIKEKYRFFGE